MNQLNNQQRVVLAELLDAHERFLDSLMREHVARLRDSSVPGVVAPPGDPADRADIEREHESAAVVRDVRALQAVEAARARLAGDAAGACIECGSAIGFERLLVQPTASRCLRCQDCYEQSRLPVSGAVN